ncbi:transcriptional regulator NrdR [Candidatus Collierbacteria bacterium CG1_02_44_10]|uniref:Transcriptional repressor NrdR n=2 Tax=Microgenomates group TaxID=1794810 RepID=A0A2M7QD20_9BACT|nr:MAG: transcriptional regulator NrdR [Candidatus Collierbacteria bacterium CG1_02_44_10]PIY69115.1 MAG: transcriptional regulator NrdR [Candidatus Roizmanbacteria bacterium CG_4_10_14_0_8_um_filter_39_9]
MFCIFCKSTDSEVIETRLSDDGTTVRRRRQCLACEKRFTTYERVEEIPFLVIKRDGRRERFERDKLKRGLLSACEKTSLTAEQIEKIVGEIEQELKGSEASEVASTQIGRWVAKRLKKLDKVAYIRFASVFKRFVDIDEVNEEVKKLM